MSIDNAESLSPTDDDPFQWKVTCHTASPNRCKPLHEKPRFVQSDRSREFRKRYFPGVSSCDWNNWHWQLQNTLRTVEDVERVFRLSDDEREAMAGASGLPTAITPYYAALMDPDNAADALRRCMIPTTAELAYSPGEAVDPLAEESQSPIDCLIHRYPDRALFLATEYCSAYCRYCTRSRMVGHSQRKRYCHDHWEKAINYIRETPAVRDVIISGGDPLTLPDEALEWLLMSLRAIPHVEVVRIGTKTPAVLPMRITSSLLKILRRANPLWMSLHFTHPGELTPETAEACARLADAGLPLGSQTVLLRGVNDEAEIMRSLMTGLMRIRVRPYYLYQCDPIMGSAHFRTPVSKGVEMIQNLRGHVSGYAVPHYVIDAPGGGGKIPILPEYVEGKDGDRLQLRNYRGGRYSYPDMPE
ncbi:MAG: KamA family radical SAM protein [Planctomycetaceae bacterium]|nr:KamA family radical SAM protein [Planctomycetaceae bacterium]